MDSTNPKKVRTNSQRMTTAPDYCGYKHWTLEEISRCFNVGKGLTRRPFSRKNRNHKWHAIVKRYGLRVEICVESLTNFDACAWEIEQIAAMGTFSTNHSHDDPNDIGCNFTKGGDGGPGHRWTDESRAKQSASHRGKAPWNKGKHLSSEQKLKLSTLNTGEKHPMFGKAGHNKGRKCVISEGRRRYMKIS